VNQQVDEDLLPSLNSLGAQTSIASFVDVALRGENDGQEEKHIGEAKYRTFGYFEPNVKSMIIILIFTHKEIWVGYVLSLCYLMYIIILQKFKMMLMHSCTAFLIQKCNND
jgi:hypothetical protein